MNDKILSRITNCYFKFIPTFISIELSIPHVELYSGDRKINIEGPLFIINTNKENKIVILNRITLKDFIADITHIEYNDNFFIIKGIEEKISVKNEIYKRKLKEYILTEHTDKLKL